MYIVPLSWSMSLCANGENPKKNINGKIKLVLTPSREKFEDIFSRIFVPLHVAWYYLAVLRCSVPGQVLKPLIWCHASWSTHPLQE
jgi:hypothetical protein